MKTEIRYPYILEQILNERKRMWNIKEYNEFKKKCKGFKKLHDKYIKKIIKLVEKYTQNKKWQYNFVPIYLISDKTFKKGKWSAFSDPLTIRLRKDRSNQRILKTLIHELVHTNLSIKKQLRRNYEENENIVEKITKKVYEDLNLQ